MTYIYQSEKKVHNSKLGYEENTHNFTKFHKELWIFNKKASFEVEHFSFAQTLSNG